MSRSRLVAYWVITLRVGASANIAKACGAEFTMPPTKVTGSTIAMVQDTCGNLIQLTQLS